VLQDGWCDVFRVLTVMLAARVDGYGVETVCVGGSAFGVAVVREGRNWAN